MAEKKQAKVFDAFNPPKDVTDPQNLGAVTHLPATLYKFGEVPGFDAIPVAWTWDRKPILNTLLVARTDAQLEEALADGWSAQPVTKPPAPKKEKAA